MLPIIGGLTSCLVYGVKIGLSGKGRITNSGIATTFIISVLLIIGVNHVCCLIELHSPLIEAATIIGGSLPGFIIGDLSVSHEIGFKVRGTSFNIDKPAEVGAGTSNSGNNGKASGVGGSGSGSGSGGNGGPFSTDNSSNNPVDDVATNPFRRLGATLENDRNRALVNRT